MRFIQGEPKDYFGFQDAMRALEVEGTITTTPGRPAVARIVVPDHLAEEALQHFAKVTSNTASLEPS
jgi:sugar-specific transcriptional regulator TrmB